MEDRTRHPVWAVYNLYRTARLNIKYHSMRLQRLEQLNLGLELAIAVAAPSSAVAGLWFWDTTVGGVLWKLLGAAAAFVAVLKPLLALPRKIKAHSEVLSGYKALEHDLFELTQEVVHRGDYDSELREDYKRAVRRKGELALKDPEAKPRRKAIRRLMEEVKRELPAAQFYVPSGYSKKKGPNEPRRNQRGQQTAEEP
jgi:hypothetical protein